MCWRRSVLQLLSLLLLTLDQAPGFSDLPHYQGATTLGKLHLTNSAGQPVLLSEKDDHVGHHVVVESFGRRYEILLTDSATPQNPSKERQRSCLYQGHEVKTHKDATITLCPPMYGFFRTEEFIFLIEPSDLQHRHLETDNRSIVTIKRHRTGLSSSVFPPRRISRQSTRQTPFTVKCLVSADVHLTQIHQMYPYMDGTNVRDYLLTVMAIVDSLFRDASFGNRISLAVSRLDYGNFFMDRKDGINKTLPGFCAYQNNLRSVAGASYDIAILLLSSPVDWGAEMSSAYPSQLCNNKFSCAVVRDIGLNSAFMVARQVGLWLGLPEDDMGQSLCGGNRDSGIMSRFWDETDLWSWSSCSLSTLNAILNKESKDISPSCLRDILTGYEENLPYPSFMRQFLLDTQCRMRYHTDAIACNNDTTKDCKQLQCSVDHRECLSPSFLAHWPDETPCGNLRSTTRMFCYQKQCLNRSMINRLEKLKNFMSDWSPWSACSRSCGGGIRQSNRTCMGTHIHCGGKKSESRFKSCNVQECPQSMNSFREYQCSQYDTNATHWYPVYKRGDRHECKLYCKTDAGVELSNPPNVIDGTRCHSDSLDLCVQGKCRYAGCDHILDSVSTVDDCGVCRGDGSTCLPKKGQKKTVTGNSVFTLPAMSAKIDIVIRDMDLSILCYLVVMEAQGQKTFRTNDMGVIFYIGGALWKYRLLNNRHRQRFTTLDRLTETFKIEIQCEGNATDYNVVWSYSYYEGLSQPIFEWRRNWTECSRECQGQRQHVLKCYRRADGSEYPRMKCNNIPVPAGHLLPPRACNLHCHYEWQYVYPCSDHLSCGQSFTITVGHKCYKRSQELFEQVNPRLCHSPEPSPEIITCPRKACPIATPNQRIVAVLRLGSQNSTCSSSCGIGYIPSSCRKIPRSALTSTDIRCKILNSFPVYRMPCSGNSCPQSENASSCAAWKHRGYQDDGEYTIAKQGKLIKLYCHGMKADPTEYLTLPAGPTRNFASIYHYQWRDPRGILECPDVQKLDRSRYDDYSDAGFSRFSKVHFLLNTMEIQTDDLRFSETNGSAPEFGMAGDCFTNPGCSDVDAKGHFQIDLQGTGLQLADTRQWTTKTILGNAVLQTTTSTTLYVDPAPISSQVVKGRCGLCTKCFIPNKKLKVKFVQV